METIRANAQTRYVGQLYLSPVEYMDNGESYSLTVLRQSPRLLAPTSWMEDEIFAVSHSIYETTKGRTILASKPSPRIADITESALETLLKENDISSIMYLSLPFHNPLQIQF